MGGTLWTTRLFIILVLHYTESTKFVMDYSWKSRSSLNLENSSWDLKSFYLRLSILQICQVLTEKNHFKLGADWTLVEHISDLKIERELQDHEIVYDVLNSWSRDTTNKMIFKNNARKLVYFMLWHLLIWLWDKVVWLFCKDFVLTHSPQIWVIQTSSTLPIPWRLVR